MSTLRIGRPVSSYKRYTPVQLASTIRQLQRQFVSVAKSRTGFYGNQSVEVKCNAIAREIRKVAFVLRTKTIQLINEKSRMLKSQYAKKLGVRVSSPKASSTAVKRLKLKIRQIQKCKRVTPLINLCTGIKLSTFKNPIVRSTTKSRTTGRTTSTRRTRSTARRPSSKIVRAYKRQTNTLKKELHKLKKRNSFMRRLVNQFRRKVAKLQRSYRAANAKPRWNVVHGKGTSNVVRFNRNTTWKQRRAG